MKAHPAMLAALTCLACACSSAAGQTNGGFESGNLGSWIDLSGGSLFLSGSPSFGFPSEGSWFAILSAGSSDGAVAGHGPHPGGGGAGKVAQLARTFVRPAGPHVEVLIDWTFLTPEPLGGALGDFLSIDLVDDATGALVHNVVFVETGAAGGAPAYTNAPGAGSGTLFFGEIGFGEREVLPHGLKRARVLLGSSTVAGQVLRLEISVGNGGDDALDSIAVIDGFALRSGQQNGAVSMRVMSSEHLDGSGSSSQILERGPYRLRAKPAQRLAFRTQAADQYTPWALLYGQEARIGTDFGFGNLNLSLATIGAVFDGINPSDAGDFLLGTLDAGANFLAAAVPVGAGPAEVTFQGVYPDATNPPFFYGLTSATTLEIDPVTRISEGTTDVTDAAGALLGVGDAGTVDLTSMSGGGFSFFGTLHTEVHVHAHGYLWFGAGSGAGSGVKHHEIFVGVPRIAPLWATFDPMQTVGAVRSSVTSEVARFTWHVPTFVPFGSAPVANRFTAELWLDGTIQFLYESMTIADGLVGITPGNLAAPSPPSGGLNLSAYSGGSRFVGGASQPIFEAFDELVLGNATLRNDVMTFTVPRLTFVPNAGGGYTCFSGGR